MKKETGPSGSGSPGILLFPRDRLVLASGSPRRHELLRMIGLDFDVVLPDIEEDDFPRADPARFAQELALAKARSVRDRFSSAVIVGADTVVVLDGCLLGKPRGEAEACEMLRTLRGRTHTVYTGVALLDVESGLSLTGHERSAVTMEDLSDEEISRYVATGEPMDKAGSYGIQGVGAVFINHISGCYFNVMGLPLARLYKMARELTKALGEAGVG